MVWQILELLQSGLSLERICKECFPQLTPADIQACLQYAKLQRRYGGRFIAREDGKVLASGQTYRALLQTIRKRKLDRQSLIVGYVPPQKAICIYALHGREDRLDLATIEARRHEPAGPLRRFLADAKTLKRAIRTSPGTITHAKLLDTLKRSHDRLPLR